MLVQKGGVDLYRELATDLWSMREFRDRRPGASEASEASDTRALALCCIFTTPCCICATPLDVVPGDLSTGYSQLITIHY